MAGTRDTSGGVTGGTVCRDCFHVHAISSSRCTACRSPNVVTHDELYALDIAHMDCDAFYASVEKRDRPELRDKAVIIGGSTRGVVSTACYIARIKGVKSAMPMFKALKLCPEAVVLKPDMKKYSAVSKQVSALLHELTPAVEHLSIDEAFMDLSGTARLHGQSAAVSLLKLARRIEKEIGVTVSIGLSHNKFLAKVASDQAKPRGFTVIGKAETRSFLAAQPVSLIWGVGKVFQQKLAKDGITGIGQLQGMELAELARRYGSMGARLYHLSRGQDVRDVSSNEENKSISSETTFDTDIADAEVLAGILWQQCERVSQRAKAHGQGGKTITLKLKTADFQIRTRSISIAEATNLAHRIFELASPLLRHEAKGTRFRLLGVGLSHITELQGGEPHSLDTRQNDLDKAENAIDLIRNKFGKGAVLRGLALKSERGGHS